MFLVIWHHAQERTDHYESFETLTAATERYEELIEQDRVYTCSIAPVLRSTDYDPVFLMPLAQKQLHDHRERLDEAFKNGDREEFQRIKQELRA